MQQRPLPIHIPVVAHALYFPHSAEIVFYISGSPAGCYNTDLECAHPPKLHDSYHPRFFDVLEKYLDRHSFVLPDDITFEKRLIPVDDLELTL